MHGLKGSFTGCGCGLDQTRETGQLARRRHNDRNLAQRPRRQRRDGGCRESGGNLGPSTAGREAIPEKVGQPGTRVGGAHDEQRGGSNRAAGTGRHQRDLHRLRPCRDQDVERLEKVSRSPNAPPKADLTQPLQMQTIIDDVRTLDDADRPVARPGSGASPGHRQAWADIDEFLQDLHNAQL